MFIPEATFLVLVLVLGAMAGTLIVRATRFSGKK
jgi:hypothetical protein